MLEIGAEYFSGVRASADYIPMLLLSTCFEGAVATAPSSSLQDTQTLVKIKAIVLI